MLQVRGILEANHITFPQAWDRSGAVANLYDVPFETLVLYLVSRDGLVVSRSVDPGGDLKEVMEGMLEGGEQLPYEERVFEGSGDSGGVETDTREGGSDFVFKGYQRIRFLGIDATGDEAVGPYGEGLQSRNDMLYRFDLEVTRDLSAYVTAGGLLRISNEGKKVLESGPRYLGSEWGSAFAEAHYERLSLRVGYYPIHMTPLTLMRWDWDDNPRTGGDAGCGCGAAAGVLLVESLEELGPELVFEGGLAAYSGSSMEARLFYAIPKRPREIRLPGDTLQYSLEIYGLEWRWQQYDSRTGSFRKAGLHFLGSRQNPRSAEIPAKIHYESFLLAMSCEIPLVRYVTLHGEWIAVNRTDEHRPEYLYTPADLEKEGSGGIAGVTFETSPRFHVKCDYMRLDREFFSPFAAISYVPNMEGVRASSRLLLPGDVSAVSVFYKRLREIELPSPDAEAEQTSYFGAAFDVDLENGAGASIGWLDKGTWRDGAVLPVDQYRRVLAVNTRYRFGKNTYAQLEYQRVMSGETEDAEELESTANLYSVYFTTIF
jgi:hypothetical protein